MSPLPLMFSAMLALISLPAAASLDVCNTLNDSGQKDQARSCYLDLLIGNDEAIHAEVFWRTGDRKTANRAFQRALEAHPDDARLRARWGLFFVSIHQPKDAEKLFHEALEIDADQVDALLGLAGLLTGRFDSKAQELIQRVLAAHPDHPGANALIARTHLQSGNSAAASEILTPLLDADLELAARLEILALLAAADHLTGNLSADGSSERSTQALSLNPHYGDAFAIPAYYYVITRRYAEAVALLERATLTQPDHWVAHADLGTNLLRLNRFDEARDHLTQAYNGDPYNAEVVNTLRLLDSLAEGFDEIVSDDLILRVHKEEAAVLAPYVHQFVADAAVGMAQRYSYKLLRPVVVELYQHHDDFAVRTAGLPGIGILGAAFGDVVVMDGPSAKPADEFDWSSALWHELAHVYTLNATSNLVSRWFSEGVSVYEERRHGPSRNSSVPLHFLEAINEERLLPVAELDEGFIRPRYPNQIAVSYVQAGLLCVYIAENFPDGLTGMLAAYANGASTEDAILQGLKVTPRELDKAFNTYLGEAYGSVTRNLNEFKDVMEKAGLALKKSQFEEAIANATVAIEMYPAYVGTDSPYLVASRAYAEHGPTHKAIDALQNYWQAGGRQPDALHQLAEFLHESGSFRVAAQVQEDLVRTVPLVAEHHQVLADWLSDLDQHERALVEYRAVAALGSHDKAATH
ncbi:MAG: tetratricopeptide repeat protein, partial [Proteobacteria bacterium]|nr:tetratricopeptide repeat protein [Pseudomonadota bacterium]